jgi:hypothetical protein
LKFSINVILSEDSFALRRNWAGHRARSRPSGTAIMGEASIPIAIALFTFFLLAPFASAETLTGTVKNGTTNKLASGDDVVLLSLSQGMEEAGRTKTDAKGSFSFKLDDASSPHLVRAIHQGVTYHRMAPPGTPSVEVEVYDVAKKIDALSVTADVMYVQAANGQLAVLRKFAVNNVSKPPRTQMNDHNFEFRLPEGAQIDSGLAKTAGGQEIKSDPVPQAEKNRYAFLFPLRPGDTEFQVLFHLPYSSGASIDPGLLYPAQHFVVILPKSMQFKAGPGALFQSMADPNQPDAIAQIASNTRPGQSLAFKISGTGEFTDTGGQPEAGAQAAGGSAAAGRDSRPGGGLGPPIDAPDPLEKYRWYILGGFGVVLATGAIYIAGRSKTASVPDFAAPDLERPTPARRAGLLLEALKEELFQLEVEHKQGRISQSEYEKAKAALDQTLERALKRGRLKTSGGDAK